MKKFISAIAIIAAAAAVSGCSDADTVSHNLSKDADNFEVPRRVVFFNGITDKYLLTIEGRCSIKADTADNQLEVTCKTGEKSYKKHYLGLSDNVSYLVEQVEGRNVSKNHYKVVFKPSTIIPDPEIR